MGSGDRASEAAREQARAGDGRFGAQARPEAATDLGPDPVHRVLDDLSETDRRLLHDALLAQVEDNHSGGVMGWDETDHLRAAEIFETLEHEPHRFGFDPTERRALLLSLAYPVHDTDHPDMAEDEWAAAESMFDHLSAGFESRAARTDQH